MWLLDKIYGTDAAEARAAELDRQREALNQKDLADGDYSKAVYEEMVRNSSRSGGDGLGGDYDFSPEIADGFVEGLDDGAGNIRGAVGSTINFGIGTPLKLIPWQVWLLGGLFVGWKLGLFDGLLKGGLKKLFKK